ncbi:MAG: ABC transporter ATP-binding protein [Gemmatimonadota bacterium]
MSEQTHLNIELNADSGPEKAGKSFASAVTWQDGALIRLRQVTRIYKEGSLEVLALRGVDLDIAEGEFTALAGPSGSGKTTLLNIIGVLDHPTSGRVEVVGQDIGRLEKGDAADFRLASVGFIFQAYNLVPVLSAYENAEFTLLLRGVPALERRNRVMPLLERVGLGDMRDRKPHELSGGQQQRVAVVRALATQPAIVLADEPTANLDSDTSAGLLDLMLELNRELRTTFLFSTHDPVVIDRARRVIRLLDGRVTGTEAVAAD